MDEIGGAVGVRGFCDFPNCKQFSRLMNHLEFGFKLLWDNLHPLRLILHLKYYHKVTWSQLVVHPAICAALWAKNYFMTYLNDLFNK